MAVLEAVRGWETLAGLPHINDVRKGEGATGTPESEKVEDKKEEDTEDELWTAERIERELGKLLKVDHVSLLLEHEKLVGEHSGSICGSWNCNLSLQLTQSGYSVRCGIISS